MTPIVSGDTLDRTIVLREHSAADGWTLHLRLVPKTGTGDAFLVDGTAAPDGASHRLQADAATTAAWPAGDYSWSTWVTNVASERFSIDAGLTKVLPDPAVVTAPQDYRTDAEKALADAEAAMAAWKPTMRKYKIAGREMDFNLAADILPILNYWKAKVQRERDAAAMARGEANPRRQLVRLSRA